MGQAEALAAVRGAWDQWVAGDVEGVLEYFTPDIAFTNPGRSPVSGVIRGHDAFREWATLLFRLAEGNCRAATTEMAAVDDDTVLIRFSVQAQRGDESINQFALQRMTVEDGKIATIQIAWTDQYEFDAFFS
jgi:ketosteroid isomerase-like protein